MCRNHGVENIVPPDEPSYEDDNYAYINHRDSAYHDIYNRWHRARCSGHAPMSDEMMDLEMFFYTTNNYGGNIHGFDMNPGIILPEKARELARRPFLDAPNILSAESLFVSVKRASELLQNVGMIRPFARMVLRTYERMNIVNNHNYISI